MPEAPTEPDSPPPRDDSSEIDSTRSWGLVDIPIGIVVALGMSLIGLALSQVFATGFDRLADDELSPSALVLSTLGLQLGMGGWVWFVVRRAGHTLADDFGFSGRNIDLAVGAAATMLIFPLAVGVNYVVSRLVGLEFGSDEAGNTEILTELGGAGLFFIMVSAVLIAPIAEELFFRGLCLRAIQRRFGTTAGVVGSTLLFVLPHFTLSSVEGTAVLFAQIGVVGLVLAALTVRFDRLGPAIVTHMLFNLVGTLIVVGTIDRESASSGVVVPW